MFKKKVLSVVLAMAICFTMFAGCFSISAEDPVSPQNAEAEYGVTVSSVNNFEVTATFTVNSQTANLNAAKFYFTVANLYVVSIVAGDGLEIKGTNPDGGPDDPVVSNQLVDGVFQVLVHVPNHSGVSQLSFSMTYSYKNHTHNYDYSPANTFYSWNGGQCTATTTTNCTALTSIKIDNVEAASFDEQDVVLRADSSSPIDNSGNISIPSCTVPDTETVTGDFNEVTPATCTTNKKGYYTATFSKGFASVSSDVVEVPDSKSSDHDYNYDIVNYAWNSVTHQCTATARCKNCSVTTSETVLGVYDDTLETYVATFSDGFGVSYLNLNSKIAQYDISFLADDDGNYIDDEDNVTATFTLKTDEPALAAATIDFSATNLELIDIYEGAGLQVWTSARNFKTGELIENPNSFRVIVNVDDNPLVDSDELSFSIKFKHKCDTTLTVTGVQEVYSFEGDLIKSVSNVMSSTINNNGTVNLPKCTPVKIIITPPTYANGVYNSGTYNEVCSVDNTVVVSEENPLSINEYIDLKEDTLKNLLTVYTQINTDDGQLVRFITLIDENTSLYGDAGFIIELSNGKSFDSYQNKAYTSLINNGNIVYPSDIDQLHGNYGAEYFILATYNCTGWKDYGLTSITATAFIDFWDADGLTNNRITGTPKTIYLSEKFPNA